MFLGPLYYMQKGAAWRGETRDENTIKPHVPVAPASVRGTRCEELGARGKLLFLSGKGARKRGGLWRMAGGMAHGWAWKNLYIEEVRACYIVGSCEGSMLYVFAGFREDTAW